MKQTKWMAKLGTVFCARRDWMSSLTLLSAVCALSGMVLLIPWEFEGLTEWRTRYQPWIFVLVVVSCSYLMVHLGDIVCRRLIKWISKSRERIRKLRREQAYQKKIIRRLYSLSEEEICLIAYLIYKNQQTITVPFPNEVTHCLEHKEIMFQARGIGARFAWPYTVQDFVWDYISAHRKDFLRHFDLNDANDRLTLERFGERMQSQKAMEEYRSDRFA
jgi:hypothetical protein